MNTVNDLLRHLKGFQEDVNNLKTTSTTINPNSNGMIEKECPKEECLSTFFVNIEDWKNILRDEEIFCPICEQPDLAKNYHASRYLIAIKDHYAKSIKERWTDGTPIKTDTLTLSSSNESKHQYICNDCETRFGTFALANACPSCGSNKIAS